MATTTAGDTSNYPTSITIPSDGDGPGINAVDVTVGLEGLADRTAWLHSRFQATKQMVDLAHAEGDGPIYDSLSPPPGGAANLVSSAVAVAIGDLVEVSFTCNATLIRGTSVSHVCRLKLDRLVATIGASPSVDLPHTFRSMSAPAIAGAEFSAPLSITTAFAAASAGILALKAVFVTSGTEDAADEGLIGAWSVVTKVWRSF